MIKSKKMAKQNEGESNINNDAAFNKAMLMGAQFLKSKFNKEGQFLQVSKISTGWELEIEVIEQDLYMKKLGVKEPVWEKYIYEIILDTNYQPLSYRRKGDEDCGCCLDEYSNE